ncbi:MAG TPA: cysteine desulfurase-like protein [Mycobacteriales bacterium]|nr:cysteine desulfurase-like protein [Mycobacteriales bacterium]
MPIDVARIRGLFPTLGDGYLHLDGPAGTLIPESVARAVGAALRVPLSGRGGAFPSSARADALVDAARRAISDLVGCDPAGVLLGPNTTTLTQAVARALSRTWRMGDEVVVSRLDHQANIRPWAAAAHRVGGVLRWAEVDIETCELPDWQYDGLLTERTRLVAVTAASNAVGTRPNVAAIAERAHRAGALMYVDAAHASSHLPIDLYALGADLITTSAYKWGGPHVGAVAATPAVLGELGDDRLGYGGLGYGGLGHDGGLELGSLPVELLAGVVAAVDHLAGLDDAVAGSRRDRVVASMAGVERYESVVFARLLGGLRSLPGVTVIGDPPVRTPTVSFTVEGWKPRAVSEELARRGVCAWDGLADAPALMEALGVAELGGAIRVGLVHYNTVHEVDRLIEILADLP